MLLKKKIKSPRSEWRMKCKMTPKSAWEITSESTRSSSSWRVASLHVPYVFQGTTGSPKGATLSHRNIVNNANLIGLRLGITEQVGTQFGVVSSVTEKSHVRKMLVLQKGRMLCYSWHYRILTPGISLMFYFSSMWSFRGWGENFLCRGKIMKLLTFHFGEQLFQIIATF